MMPVKPLPPNRICVRFNCRGTLAPMDEHPGLFYCPNCGQIYTGKKR